MTRDSLRLQASARLMICKLVSITLAMFLSFPSSALASPRGGLSQRVRLAMAASALLGTVIEVNTTGDGDNINPSAGCDTDAATPGNQCSLRAAIQQANAVAGDDEIHFNIPLTEPNCIAASSSCYLYLTNTLPPLGTNVRIIGPGSDKISIRRSTGGDYRIFTVTAATDITISGVTISNGRPAGLNVGGAIANAGNATVNILDSVLSYNVAGADGGDGGAIANAANGIINIVNTLVTDNSASIPVVDGAAGGGGAILNSSTGTVNISGSFFADNKVQGGRHYSSNRGGVIHNTSAGAVNVTNSALVHNTVTVGVASYSSGGGAAIANSGEGTVTVVNSVFADNLVTGGDQTSDLMGGGVLNVASTGKVDITQSIFSNNIIYGGSANGGGGGIFNASGVVNVSNSTLTGNRGLGGGIKGQATVKNTIIAKNNFGPSSGSDISGTFTSAGFNLVGVEDGSTGFNGADQKGTAAAPLDPKFDPNTVDLPFVNGTVPVP
ncbi:MAG TPA: hypothetical protein VLE19_10770, partial [Pyrinomonadaceae bacterium]|nr:hypothetical protein [Pyrinomonadaceae bacterium]